MSRRKEENKPYTKRYHIRFDSSSYSIIFCYSNIPTVVILICIEDIPKERLEELKLFGRYKSNDKGFFVLSTLVSDN
jgi:hypothetical protein